MVMRRIGGADGTIVDFGNLTDSQVDQLMQSGKLDDMINNPDKYKAATPSTGPTPTPTTTPTPETDQPTTEPAPAVRTAGETPRAAPPSPPPVQPAPPGFQREAGIAAGQFLRGTASPISIPGDLNLMASEATGGLIPQSRYLPTSFDLDRRMLGPAYAPQGFWENELAAGSRSAGEAATFPLMPAAGRLGLASVGRPVGQILPTAAEMGRTIASGAVGGAAGEAEAQTYTPDPLHPGLAAVGPVATSALASGLTMAGIRGASDAITRYRYGDPYTNVQNRLGFDMDQNTPTMETAGRQIKTALNNNMAAAVATNKNPGAGGVPGTDLDPDQAASIINASPLEAFNHATQGSEIAPILAKEMPNEANTVTAAGIANNRWGGFHTQAKNALISNDEERAAVNAVHGKQPSSSEQTENIIARLIRGEYGGGLLGALGGMVVGQHTGEHSQIGSLLTLAGYLAPYAKPAVARFLNQPQILRQTATGAFVGIPTATYMTTPPNQYSPATMPSGQQ